MAGKNRLKSSAGRRSTLTGINRKRHAISPIFAGFHLHSPVTPLKAGTEVEALAGDIS